MTKRKRDAARQSSAKTERPKTTVEGTVGRRSFLKGAALFAGGTAAGTVASPFLGNSKAQAGTDRSRRRARSRRRGRASEFRRATVSFRWAMDPPLFRL